MPDLKMSATGGRGSTAIRILKQHVGVTAIDVWDDTDHNGRPDQFLRRAKAYNDHENEPIELDEPGALDGKVVQWIWMPSQPPQSTDGWEVEIDVTQGGKSLPNMPMRLA